MIRPLSQTPARQSPWVEAGRYCFCLEAEVRPKRDDGSVPGLWQRLFPPVRSGLTVLEGLGRIDLHYAAIEGDVKRIKALLRSGSDPNHQDPEGLTPLHMAAIHNQPASLPVLLKAGARVDLPDRAGNHPLFRAVMSSNGDCRVIRLLLAAGADPDHENHHGNSPRSTANLIANYDVARCFERE